MSWNCPMKISHIIFFSLVSVCSCAKWEQHKETSFDAVVTDITTGKMDSKAYVVLYELETPTAPFSSVKKTAIQDFSVNYDEPFSFKFNAKRGAKYEYILEFSQCCEGGYNSGRICDGFTYENIYQCTLIKKETNNCMIKVEPTTGLNLYAKNIPPNASENDSIWIECTDGFVCDLLSFKGIGTSPSGSIAMPHGYYTLSYTVYNNGIEQYSNSYPVELKHNRDTSIVVEF